MSIYLSQCDAFGARKFIGLGRLLIITTLLVVVIGITSSCAPKGAVGDGEMRVALGWLNNVQWAGFWVAQNEGSYSKDGLSVTFQPGGANKPDPTVLVSSGKADIGISTYLPTLVQSIIRGNDFVIIGAGYQQTPAGVLSLPSNPVRTPKDLLGKTVLLHQGDQPNYDAMLKMADLPVDYKATVVGYDPTVIFKGEGQALNVFATNEPITLEQEGKREGKDFLVSTYQQMGISQYSNVIFCKREYLRNHRDGVIKFLRNSALGWHKNASDPDATAQMVVDKYGADLDLNSEQQKRQNRLQIPFTTGDDVRRHGMFWVDQQRLGGVDFEALKATGIGNLPDSNKIVDVSVLREAYKGGIIS